MADKPDENESEYRDVSDTIERRTTILRVELRNGPDGRPGRLLGGYAAVFNRDSRNLGGYVERIVPSFFDQEFRSGWPGVGAGVIARFNHDPNFLLGTTRSGTLQLKLDGTGLDYTVDVPETRSDVYELGQRGDLNGSSFAFSVDSDGCEWSYNDLGITQRTLLQGRLIDVAPVSEPAAYPDATVALRGLAAAKDAAVEDVVALAAKDELRRFFTRSDQAMQAALPVDAIAVEVLPIEEERTVTTETPPEPAAEPADVVPPVESEEPRTLSWQEAKLHLLKRRPDDPII